jgi:hypothetical protein
LALLPPRFPSDDPYPSRGPENFLRFGLIRLKSARLNGAAPESVSPPATRLWCCRRRPWCHCIAEQSAESTSSPASSATAPRRLLPSSSASGMTAGCPPLSSPHPLSTPLSLLIFPLMLSSRFLSPVLFFVWICCFSCPLLGKKVWAFWVPASVTTEKEEGAQTDKVQCYEPATMKYLRYFPVLTPNEVIILMQLWPLQLTPTSLGSNHCILQSTNWGTDVPCYVVVIFCSILK